MTDASYHLTSEAQADLIAIRRFGLRQWGVAQVQKYLAELYQTLQLLAEMPSLGKSRPDVEEGVYSFPHSSHIIYYVMHQQKLIVFSVLNKRMVPSKHLAQRATEY